MTILIGSSACRLTDTKRRQRPKARETNAKTRRGRSSLRDDRDEGATAKGAPQADDPLRIASVPPYRHRTSANRKNNASLRSLPDRNRGLNHATLVCFRCAQSSHRAQRAKVNDYAAGPPMTGRQHDGCANDAHQKGKHGERTAADSRRAFARGKRHLCAARVVRVRHESLLTNHQSQRISNRHSGD